MPNTKNMKGAGALAGWNLKGGLLAPEHPTAVPDLSVVRQQATTDQPASGATQPTQGFRVMVTQDNHQKLPTVAQQGNIYTHAPIHITSEPVAASTQRKDPVQTTDPTPEPAPAGTQGATFGPAPLQTSAGPEPAEALPHGKYYEINQSRAC